MRRLDDDDSHGVTGHHELRRGNAGRHEIVLSRRDREGQSEHFIHVRPGTRPGRMSVRFRDGNALTLMGFKARPACPMFPLACAFAGCYYVRLTGRANDEANALRVFDRLCQDLESATDKILDGVGLALELRLPIRTP